MASAAGASGGAESSGGVVVSGEMGDRSCFMQLPGGAPAAGGDIHGKSNEAKGSSYAAKALQEEDYCFGANAYSKPQSKPAAAPAVATNPNIDTADRSCFMGPPK